jgi:C-terminal processing protease CtpA/Prc
MVGDLILEVNGQDIRKSSYNNAAFLLKTLPQGKVNLKIGRLKLSANSSVQNSANTSKQGSRKGSFSLVKKIDS